MKASTSIRQSLRGSIHSLALRPNTSLPLASPSSSPPSTQGLVLRGWLTLTQAGFSPAGLYALLGASHHRLLVIWRILARPALLKGCAWVVAVHPLHAAAPIPGPAAARVRPALASPPIGQIAAQTGPCPARSSAASQTGAQSPPCPAPCVWADQVKARPWCDQSRPAAP